MVLKILLNNAHSITQQNKRKRSFYGQNPSKTCTLHPLTPSLLTTLPDISHAAPLQLGKRDTCRCLL